MYEKKSQIIQAFLQTPEGEERFQRLVLVLEDLFSCIDIDDFLDFTAHALAEFVAHEEFESFTEEYKRRCVYDSVSLASKLLRVKDVYKAIDQRSHAEINKMPTNGQSAAEMQ